MTCARTPVPCGTQAAYQRHIRHGETPCEPCRKIRRRHQYINLTDLADAMTAAERERVRASQSALLREVIAVLAEAMGVTT